MEIEKVSAGSPASKKQKTSATEKFMMVLVTLALAILFIPKSLINKFEESSADSSVVLIRFDGTFNDNGQISANKSVPLLKSVCGKPTLKTLVLHLSSEGGHAVEGERVASAVGKYCEKKHVIALVESSCLSACYGVAAKADEIWASQSGYVGSIGSMISWVDYSVALERQGVKEMVLTSGQAKGPSMGRQMPTSIQVQDLQSALTSSGLAFARTVRESRKGRISKDAPIETGGIYAPEQALALGLIDDIKTIDDVRDRFGKEMTEIGPESTGSPFNHVGRNRGEELLYLALQKAREAIETSK
jgi:protease-4